MASSSVGQVSNGYFTVTVPDSSCDSVKVAVNDYYAGAWVADSCSDSFVLVGTNLHFHSAVGQIVDSPLTIVTAKPLADSLFAADFDTALAAQFFAASFIPILFLFFFSKAISSVVHAVKTL